MALLVSRKSRNTSTGLTSEEGPLNIPAGFASDREELKNRIYNAVHASIEDQAAAADAVYYKRLSRKQSIYRYAAVAAVLLIVSGFTVYLLMNSQSKPQPVAYNNKACACRCFARP